MTVTWMDFEGPSFSIDVPSDWYIAASPQFQARFIGPEVDGPSRPNVMVALDRVEEV